MTRRTAVVVAWHYPPGAGVGGRRPQQLFEHLGEFGWDVRVVTARMEEGTRDDPRIIETARGKLGEWIRAVLPSKDEPLFEQWSGEASQGTGGSVKARALRAARGLLMLPDEHAPWAVIGRAAAAHLDQVDAVISTSPPFSAHLLGRWLARRFDAPHVVDYRDPYSRNAGWPAGRLDRPLKEALDRRVLSGADAVVTTSDAFAALLGELGADRVDVVRNAWADADRAEGASSGDSTLTLVQTGTLYADYQPLLERLRAAMEGRDVRLIHCGRGGELARWADDRGFVSREEAARLRASASALVLLLPETEETWGIPAKLYDYIASGRPVLTIGAGDPEKRRLLSEAGLAAPVEDVGAALDDLIARQAAGTLSELAADAAAIDGHGARALAERYAAVLDRITTR